MKIFLKEKVDILEMENNIELKKRDLGLGELLFLTLLLSLIILCLEFYKDMVMKLKYRYFIKCKVERIVF